jgi:Flp pilus assembly protein TadD
MSEAYQLFQKGLAALASGHADEAIVPLERARRMEPDSMSIHEALGKTYLRLGFFDRAVEAFTTILEREPIDAYAHFCLARSYDRLGQVRSARKHYRLATFFAPERTIYRDTLRVFLQRAFPDGESHDEDDDSGEWHLPRVFGE